MSGFSKNTTFQSDVTKRNEKYVRYLEKREYVSKNTEMLDNLSTLAFLGALFTGAITIDLSRKLKTTEKISVGLMAAATVLLGVKWIRGYQISKQYDKEFNSDTKSNAKD